MSWSQAQHRHHCGPTVLIDIGFRTMSMHPHRFITFSLLHFEWVLGGSAHAPQLHDIHVSRTVWNCHTMRLTSRLGVTALIAQTQLNANDFAIFFPIFSSYALAGVCAWSSAFSSVFATSWHRLGIGDGVCASNGFRNGL